MKKLIYPTAFLLAFAVPTLAQQQTPTEFHLTVTNEDVNIMGKALGKLPFDDVALLIQKLRTQIIDQQVPRKEDAKPVVPVEPK